MNACAVQASKQAPSLRIFFRCYVDPKWITTWFDTIARNLSTLCTRSRPHFGWNSHIPSFIYPSPLPHCPSSPPLCFLFHPLSFPLLLSFHFPFPLSSVFGNHVISLMAGSSYLFQPHLDNSLSSRCSYVLPLLHDLSTPFQLERIRLNLKKTRHLNFQRSNSFCAWTFLPLCRINVASTSNVVPLNPNVHNTPRQEQQTSLTPSATLQEMIDWLTSPPPRRH